MKRITTLLVGLVALLAGLGPRAAAAEEGQPATIVVGGQPYTVVLDEEVRKLGFKVPDVKPEENAAYDYLKAIDAYRSIERGDPLLRLRDEVMRSGWSEEAAPLAEYIEQNEEALKWIRSAASKDVCHFPVLVPLGSSIEETSPAGILLPYLSAMREFARFLLVVGKADEFEGRYGDALDAYLTILRLGNHVAQDPILINGLVGIACNMIGARAIEPCLVRNEIDDAILAEAQERLAALAGGRPNVVVSMGGERAWSTSMVEHLTTHPRWLAEYVDADEEMSKAQHTALVLMLQTEAGRAQIRADVREFWDAMEKAMEMPLPEFIRTAAGEEPALKAKARKVPPNIMALLGTALSGARLQFGRNDLSWTVLDVEFALARYAAKHDQYPESLDAVKDFMLGDGIDPFSGEPLKYRLEPDGAFTLWSVGENLVDDGGAMGRACPDWRADDFVWNSAVINSTK
jgi:hypothetical protein